MTPHDILGVRAGASPAEIRAAYRSFASRHHHDAGGDPDLFMAFHDAYRALLARPTAASNVVFVRRRRGVERLVARWALRRRPPRVV